MKLSKFSAVTVVMVSAEKDFGGGLMLTTNDSKKKINKTAKNNVFMLLGLEDRANEISLCVFTSKICLTRVQYNCYRYNFEFHLHSIFL